MKKLSSIILVTALIVVASLGVSVFVHAQTTGQTPVFYSQNGAVMNSGGTALPAGTYYNQSGQQVYYYGNGTYYTPATGLYGGTAFSSESAPVTTTTGTPIPASSGATPLFYSSNGTVLNSGGTLLPAGNYYNQSGQQVYYYGNGTYYNPVTELYGGTAFGTAAVAAAPGVPDTGFGGDAPTNFAILAAAGIILIAGTAYLARSSRREITSA
jgi:hypothetical protein